MQWVQGAVPEEVAQHSLFKQHARTQKGREIWRADDSCSASCAG